MLTIRVPIIRVLTIRVLIIRVLIIRVLIIRVLRMGGGAGRRQAVRLLEGPQTIFFPATRYRNTGRDITAPCSSRCPCPPARSKRPRLF